MKLSYAITVCNEFLEIQRLLPFIISNKRPQDEIVVLVDLTKNSPTSELLGYLHKLSSNNHIILSEQNFNGDFARWKNILNNSCNGDYIFQIDADEMPTEYMMKIIPQVIESNDIDLKDKLLKVKDKLLNMGYDGENYSSDISKIYDLNQSII